MTKYKKDLASATLVTGIISILFICLCAGFAVDVAKNSYMKSSLDSRAQQSAEIALKQLDARGSIKETALNTFVYDYTGGGNNGGTYANDETKNFTTGACTTQTITTWDGTVRSARMPYIVFRLDTQRAIGTNSGVVYVSEGGGLPVRVSGTYNPSLKYTVLAADVHDATANFMLNMFGMSCQKFNPKVSSIAFGSAGDLPTDSPSTPAKTAAPTSTSTVRTAAPLATTRTP